MIQTDEINMKQKTHSREKKGERDIQRNQISIEWINDSAKMYTCAQCLYV